MADEVWTTEQNASSKIVVAGDEIQVSGKVTAKKVKEVAADHGLVHFYVEDANGTLLTVDDFPYQGTVIIKELNEAKN
jgi:hypothetical protein